MPTRVLFVCMGNICRSPTAEGVFRKLAEEAGLLGALDIDSAGTLAAHAGEPPDTRTCQAAAARGFDLGQQRARQVQPADFERFDHILAMDEDNLQVLEQRCPPAHRHKLRLFLDGAGVADTAVPDPYYGGKDGFERVLDLVDAGARALLARLQPDLSARRPA